MARRRVAMSSSSEGRAILEAAVAEGVMVGPGLATVPETGGDAFDRQVDALADHLVGLAGAVAAQKLHLQEIERVDVGQTQADRLRQLRGGFQEDGLAG